MATFLSVTLWLCASAFVLGFALNVFAYRRGLFDDHDDEHEQATDDKTHTPSELFIAKWLQLGGGYYGCIAFIHLLKIELMQIFELITQWKGLDAYLKGSGLNSIINLVVSMLVEQYHAFAAAISWPATYLSNYSFGRCAIIVGCSYGAYYVSQLLAARYHNKTQ